MYRLLTILLVAAMAASAAAADPALAEGHWRLSQHQNPVSTIPICVIKVDKKDGKYAAAVTDTLTLQGPKKGPDAPKLPVKVASVAVDGAQVRIDIVVRDVQKLSFLGSVGADAKSIAGTLGTDDGVTRARLIAQKDGTLHPLSPAEQPVVPEPIQRFQKLSVAANQLQNRAIRSMDPDEKADLMAQAKAARAELAEKGPALFRETFEKHRDSLFAVEAATQLVRMAGRIKANPKEVDSWLKAIEAEAAPYGRRFRRDTHLVMAEVLNIQAGYAPMAADLAAKAAKAIDPNTPPTIEERILRVKASAEAKAGPGHDPKPTQEKLAKVVAKLDAEYQKSTPAFKVEKFAGRKDKGANRPAVFELFTGAQCPPCVAADVAFDALAKAYDTKDLILIQYHVHIPGPDPLANRDAMERMAYYGNKFPGQIGGAPSAVFGGRPFFAFNKNRDQQGGGPLANAKPKFDQYRAIIDPLLEEKTGIKLVGSAKRSGGKISIDVTATGIDEPRGSKRLRLVLAEETVKYVGNSGVRFHHKVVRAMPGGVGGTPLPDATLQKAFFVDLPELKATLNKHLDAVGAESAFPHDERPMDLATLKVIALVQDDDTGEILQAVEFAVDGK